MNTLNHIILIKCIFIHRYICIVLGEVWMKVGGEKVGWKPGANYIITIAIGHSISYIVSLCHWEVAHLG